MSNNQQQQESTDTYARQKLIKEVKPVESAIVIGVGGVGSWVALFLALSGTKNLMLVDPDIVEEHNRARTMFRPFDVGLPKATALTGLLMELREEVNVMPLEMRCEDIDPAIIAEPEWQGAMLFDCRDNTDALPSYFPNCSITGGYDGLRVTIFQNPDSRNIFGRAGPVTYTTTPSYVVPPAFLASQIVLYATVPALHSKEERESTFSLMDMFKQNLIEGVPVWQQPAESQPAASPAEPPVPVKAP